MPSQKRVVLCFFYTKKLVRELDFLPLEMTAFKIKNQLTQLVASRCNREGRGPLNELLLNNQVKQAEVAQLVEQLICNQQVAGSSPIFGSQFK